MPYDFVYDSDELELGDVFRAIDRTLGITVGSDARDPLDNDEFIIPRTTPMAPVRYTSVEVGANTHDHGIWMPIRRVLVTDVNVDGLNFTVVDADPFHESDHIISIDSAGPATGGGVNLAIITAINYTTNVITVAATAGLQVGDWVEVMENCCTTLTAVVPSSWQIPMVTGMLLGPYDSRMTKASTAGSVMHTTVVTHGKIRELDINFPDYATDDEILVVQVQQWNTASGGIEIVTLEHGDEAVDLPDFFFSSSSSSSSSSSFSSSSESSSSFSSSSSSESSSSFSSSSSSLSSSSSSYSSSSFSSSSSCSSS